MPYYIVMVTSHTSYTIESDTPEDAIKEAKSKKRSAPLKYKVEQVFTEEELDKLESYKKNLL